MNDERENSQEAIRGSIVLSECSLGLPVSKASQQAERAKWWKVYLMHFLFMWNLRTYEYASASHLNSRSFQTQLIVKN